MKGWTDWTEERPDLCAVDARVFAITSRTRGVGKTVEESIVLRKLVTEVSRGLLASGAVAAPHQRFTQIFMLVLLGLCC